MEPFVKQIFEEYIISSNKTIEAINRRIHYIQQINDEEMQAEKELLDARQNLKTR